MDSVKSVPILRDPADLRALAARWRQAGETIAVVPTMGALHAGHLSLVEAAKAGAGRVIVTVFVNPRQFTQSDDLENYPRTEKADAKLLEPYGIDALFAPEQAVVYPQGHATTVSVAGLSTGLCGQHRPGHFDGMATVVVKLLMMTQADLAFFGEKDWQQMQIVRRLVTDLDIPCRIVTCPTLRDADGLALSSRNLRLDAQARYKAAVLPEVLAAAAKAMADGGTGWARIRARAVQACLDGGFERIEYLELRDAETLGHPVAGQDARILAAGWIGGVRLIDNVAVPAGL